MRTGQTQPLSLWISHLSRAEKHLANYCDKSHARKYCMVPPLGGGFWSLWRVYLNWCQKSQKEQVWELLVEDTTRRGNKEFWGLRIESLGTFQGRGAAAWWVSWREWEEIGVRYEAGTSNRSWILDLLCSPGHFPKTQGHRGSTFLPGWLSLTVTVSDMSRGAPGWHLSWGH